MGRVRTWIMAFQSYCLSWTSDVTGKMFSVNSITGEKVSKKVSKIGLNSLTRHYGSSELWLLPVTLTDKLLKTLSFLKLSQFNPRSHPAARQSWTNMELNREIQSEYKQVIFQMNNTLSTTALTCNKNSHVFLSLHWEQLFAWFLCAADNTAPLIVWITHYNVYSLPFVARVSRVCLNSIHLGIGLDAGCIHRRPPSVTLYADGLKMNKQNKDTHSAI